MTINGIVYPTISCNNCKHRHPAHVSCQEADIIAKNNHINEANAPTGVDTNSLLYVCKRLVEAKPSSPGLSSYEFELAWEQFKAIVDKLPEHL